MLSWCGGRGVSLLFPLLPMIQAVLGVLLRCRTVAAPLAA